VVGVPVRVGVRDTTSLNRILNLASVNVVKVDLDQLGGEGPVVVEGASRARKLVFAY